MYSNKVTHDLLYSLKVLVYAIASTCTHIMYYKAYPATVQLQKEAAGRRLASFYRFFDESVDTGDIHKRVLHL